MTMGFGQAIATCLRKYAIFSGRASRSEFWWFYLFSALISLAAGVAGAAAFPVDPAAAADFRIADIPGAIVGLALLLPTLAVAVRRLHDWGRSGWWLLLALTGIGYILLLVWWALPSVPEDNKHGSPPARAGA